MTVYAITDTKKGEQGLRLLIFKLPAILVAKHSPEGEKSMHIIKHPKKDVNLKNNFEVRPRHWGWALRWLGRGTSQTPPPHPTTTTELLYKNNFLGEGAQSPPQTPVPHPTTSLL